MASGSVEASVIIPALNAAEHIEGQLLALAAQQTAVSWELIVADNGSTDDTIAIVQRVTAEYPVPVRVIDASARNGAIGARNAGVAVADGEFLLFADADDVVDDFWVQEMVRALRAHPFVGGKLEVVELNGEEVAGWRPRLADDRLPTWGGFPWAVGCNFGCTAAAFEEVGGFDETLFGDVDIAVRMHAHGMPAVFAERAIVHYRYRREPGEAIRQMWRYGRHSAPRYARYRVEPLTALDAVVVCYRSAKWAVRDVLKRRRPVRPLVEVTYVLGEASLLWRRPAFWRPVCRREFLANPLLVLGDRLRRLGRLVVGGRGTERD
jgi:glycosyltransferase involved in cell wall biosynthesis